MKSVIENQYSFVIKNSRFICFIYPIHTTLDVTTLLNQVKNIYPDATHYCYAFILDSIHRQNDDGEPSGTAGTPILQVLEKNNLNHVLCIVVRYFGKIKLGASGLIRAYTKAATSCLENHIIDLKKAFVISISFPYSQSKNIDYLLKNSKIISKKFENDIIYQAIVDTNTYQSLSSVMTNTKIEILSETYLLAVAVQYLNGELASVTVIHCQVPGFNQ